MSALRRLVYTGAVRGRNMNCRKIAIFGAALFARRDGSRSVGRARADDFQNYRCADGTQFIVGFFQYDSRAHLQLDGKAVTLAKRLALSGSRYSGSGVTLKITQGRAHHAQARQTAGHGVRADMKKGRNVFVPTLFYFPTAPEASGASLPNIAPASVVTPGLGFLDGRRVVPAAAAGSEVDRRGRGNSVVLVSP